MGSFWWRDVLKLTPKYRGVSRVQVVDGTTAFAWKDLWLDETLETSHPRAFSYVLHEDASVENFLESSSLHETFHLPLSPEAFEEVCDIQTIARLQHSTTTNDIWHCIWGKPDFRAADYYKFCFRELQAHPLF